MGFALSLKIILRRSKVLKYITAQNVLPEEVIKIIQQYVDGEYIYIPRKGENIKAWGEKNGTKIKLNERNAEICEKHTLGTTVNELSCQYYLSEQSIKRIIYEQEKKY